MENYKDCWENWECSEENYYEDWDECIETLNLDLNLIYMNGVCNDEARN